MGTEEAETNQKVVIRQLNTEAKEKKPFEHTIGFNYHSPVDGKDYVGTFTYKKFQLGDYGKVTAIRIRLNGGNPDDVMDARTLAINNAIAHLSVWFYGQEGLPGWAKDFTTLYDSEIVFTLFQEGLSFENSFRKAVAG